MFSKPATWLVVASLIGPVTAGAPSSSWAALPPAPSATTAPSLPVIPGRVFRITDYGAVGDGKTDASRALNAAIDACAKAGGGTVDIPSGRFLTRPFVLASNLNLHLAAGAVLLLTTDPKDYEEAGKRNRNGITAEDCHDVAVTGSGTIDGQGSAWWPRYVKTYVAPSGSPPPMHRPYMLTFSRCTRVLVEGVTLTNSPSFHLVPAQCQDVTLRNLRILAPANAPNTDGIDPSGWNFLITGCAIDVGDDNIALKPSGRIAPDQPSCRNFLIEHCTFRHGHGMSIGGQTPGGLENLVVRDCTFEDTQAGIRMKAGRGSGGLVENALYEHLTMKRVKVPIYITSYYPRVPDDPAADPAQPVAATTPIWRHIRIQDVTVIDSPEAGRIIGLAEMPVEDVEFRNVHITAAKKMKVVHARGIRFVESDVMTPEGASAPLPTPITINLWPGDPPGKVPGSGPGADDGTGRYRNVGVPGMLVYVPQNPVGQAKAARRIAIIACPGGGYSHLTRLEGADGAVAAFTPRDVVVVSLKYRLKPPSVHVEDDTLADIKRAVRLVRAHAAEWGVDPKKVGVLGWSAGANLGLNLASYFDTGSPAAPDPIERQSSRPDFVVLLSPWPDGNALSAYPIGKDSPPAFIGTASDDRTAPPAFAVGINAAYRASGTRSELMHVETGGHGAFTIDGPGPGGKWVDRFWLCLATVGIRKGNKE